MNAMAPILEADDVTLHFPVGGAGPFGFGKRSVKVLNGISLTVRPGETIGLVGESGSGKSTLGRALLGLEDITSGHVSFDQSPVSARSRGGLGKLRRETAMVFQDPSNVFNPRMTVGETIAEVLKVHAKRETNEIEARIDELLSLVGLDPALKNRKPQALSGGQCQRVGIARALAVEPRLVVADECVAALDVSIQGQIINLFIDLKRNLHLTLIFIAHDLAIVRRLCDRVAVMYLGKIVEEGPTEQIFAAPRHPYTAALIEAIPEIDPNIPLPDQQTMGEPPSPLDIPPGCSFHPRCPHAKAVCRRDPPPTLHVRDGHAWACVLEPGDLPPPTSATPSQPINGDQP